MSDLAAIRAAIVATIQGVPGIGIVHGRRRNLRSQADVRAAALADGKVNVWMVTREATAETSPDLGGGVTVHRWAIRGFRQFDDGEGGELAMDDLIEAIRDAFRASEDLGIPGLTTVTGDAAGIQVADTVPVVLGGYLCAACTLHLFTRCDT